MTSNQPTNVFIVEDDPATRASLAGKIKASPSLTVAGHAETLEEARAALKTGLPDVLLVDLQLPDGDGSALIAELTADHPHVPILVISVFGDERSVVRAITAGAQGYLLKDAPGDNLTDAILQVLEGHSPISPGIARHIIRVFQDNNRTDNGEPSQPASVLSDRELEILQLASKGLSNKETANALGISVNTVGTHTRRVYTKLAVSSRAEALFEARQLGLLDR